MHLLGCLLFLVFFILIFGMALVGSVVDFVWRLLFGSSRSSQRSNREQPQRTHREERPVQEPASYTFRPEDGEYIDYEEVRN